MFAISMSKVDVVVCAVKRTLLFINNYRSSANERSRIRVHTEWIIKEISVCFNSDRYIDWHRHTHGHTKAYTYTNAKLQTNEEKE